MSQILILEKYVINMIFMWVFQSTTVSPAFLNTGAGLLIIIHISCYSVILKHDQ